MTQVEKIHREIDTAQERLLREAFLLISMNEVSQELKEKADRLAKVGFISNPLAKIVSEKSAALVHSTAQANLIKHYKDTYSGYKFLTESEFDRICNKYGLIYASVKYYTKDIPEQNLKDIENMPALERPDDLSRTMLVRLNINNTCANTLSAEERNVLYVTGFPVTKQSTMDRIYPNEACTYLGRKLNFRWEYAGIEEVPFLKRDGLFIAAPKTHFDLKGLEQQGLGFFEKMMPLPKDPIVFRYVRGGIQVITKWGVEANDPNLLVF
jgi:hypothetical protein